MGGVKYEQVLEALDQEINIENIKLIQITEKDCIVTVSEPDVKQRLLRVGLRVMGQPFWNVPSSKVVKMKSQWQ